MKTKDQKIKGINKQIEKLNEKIWELQKKKMKLKGTFGIKGCDNTRI